MADDGDTERLRIILELEAERAEKSAKSLERQIGALERRFDPLAKATSRYERDQRTLNKALETGKIDAERYQKAIDNVEKEYRDAQEAAGRATQAINANSVATGRASVAANQLGGANRGMGSIVSRNRSIFQQAGYQIGDFAVQVGSGTNAMMAFGQQAPQMLGAFGAFGAIAGAAIAIAAPMIGALLRMEGGGKNLEEQLEALTDATDAYIEATKNADTPVAELTKRHGELADVLERVLDAERDIAQERSEAARTAAFSRMFDNVLEIPKGLPRVSSVDQATVAPDRGFNIEGQRILGFIRDVQEAYKITEEQARRMVAAIQDGQMAETTEEQTKAAGDLHAVMMEVAGSAEEAGTMFGETFTALGEFIENSTNELADLNELKMEKLGEQFDWLGGKIGNFLGKIGITQEALDRLMNPTSTDFEGMYSTLAARGGGSKEEELVRAVTELARQMGISAKDLLTVMSYETAGTLDPSITNPQGYTGLIQFSPDNQQRYGVGADSTITEQVIAAGKYLENAGIKAGDGLLRIYAAILAGDPDKINTIDRYNGGSAASKVDGEMEGHRARAEGLLAAYGGVVQEVSTRQPGMRPRSRSDGRAANNEARWDQQAADEAEALALETAELERAAAARERYNANLAQSAEAQELERSLIGKTAAEQAEARLRFQLMNEAKEQGIKLDEEYRDSGLSYLEVIEAQARVAGENVRVLEQQAEAKKRLAETEKEAAAQAQFYESVQQRLKDGLVDAIVAGESFADVLANVAQMLAKAALQAALFGDGPMGGGGGLLTNLMSGVFGGGSRVAAGHGSAIAGALGGAIAGARATGGPVSSGESYLIGERGPEVFRPNVPGAIVPNHKLGAASAQKLDVGISIDGAGNLLAIIRNEAGQVVASQRQSIVGEALGKAPAYLNDQRMRTGNG